MVDIVIGSIINYDWNQIKYWVNSLDHSGFDGEKLMICFNIDKETIKMLTDRNYNVLSLTSDNVDINNFNIVVDRFYYIWNFLEKYKSKYRYVIATDVKDVVFQKDPVEYLHKKFTNDNSSTEKGINISTESLLYKDEDWGYQNMWKSFGSSLYNHTKNNLILNAGVIAGKCSYISDLSLSIYLMCNGASGRHIAGGGGPDQAALNIILNTKPWKESTIVNFSEDGWAAQLGTTGPQISNIVKEKLIEKQPIILNNFISTSRGKTFSIVHQYDRFSEWDHIIKYTYKD